LGVVGVVGVGVQLGVPSAATVTAAAVVSSSPPDKSLLVVPLWVLVNPFLESRDLRISGLLPVGDPRWEKRAENRWLGFWWRSKKGERRVVAEGRLVFRFGD
jgi:hypothetical protein